MGMLLRRHRKSENVTKSEDVKQVKKTTKSKTEQK